MSRWIKFDDAVKVMACEMYAEAQSQGYDVDGIEDFMSEAKAGLNDAPSIDIVRCKECKHCNEWEHPNGIELYCNNPNVDPFDWGGSISFYVKADGYCSWGERKSDE